ncbi:DUF3862 domain-containing protein [Lactiplantibacillus argentoratensis]|uniref:DUF3862 domain-containing protein n=1 Tax=Lactiplantibacillus argentoratensis TaxID=271881 RepID=A0ABS5UGH3_9LACO|nr:DUF3862 domain-containing protein [Lactiplantibacillus argentoratensis]MBT1137668.1 DUF3862 domain-containing protein [Lactiplantibacillus argentoratensis]MBT1140526.1 DUF3862 domain-containing protein [Lactiplantibacillus argentoratensis]
MKKITTITVALLAGLTLTACGKTSSTSSSSTSATSKKSTTSSETTSNGITLDNYKSIQVALPNSGTATNEAKVKSMFGKPDQSTKTSITGLDKEATQYTWTNVGKTLSGATVTASFYGGKAVAKAYSNASLTPNAKLTTTTVNGIKQGDSLSSVEAKLGTPNAESISGSGALSAQIINYTSIKGKSGASVSFTFTNNKLVTTTKSSFN